MHAADASNRRARSTATNAPDAMARIGRRHRGQLPRPARWRQVGRAAHQVHPRNDARRCGEENAPPRMPPRSPTYIYETFYSPEARVRNKPARVELSRLTVRQYQNAVADLIGSFRPAGRVGHRARTEGRIQPVALHRAATRRNNSSETIRRSISISATRGPIPKQFEGKEFSIRWRAPSSLPIPANMSS